jgi:FADH2 O2-dependent halogenase
MTRIDADVAVLGAGFGGSLMALILSRLGLRPALIDRGAHPRFAIGESSTPTADLILRALSDRYRLPRLRPLSAYGPWKAHYAELRVGLKRGFSYFHHRDGERFQPQPDHRNELLVTASTSDFDSDTQWHRADVDAFFAAEARRHGIPYFEHTELAPRRDGSGWTLEGRRNGEPFGLEARFVVDATGPAGVMPRALGLTASAARFHTHSRALYAHFDGVPPWRDFLTRAGARVEDHPFHCDHAALHHVFEGGWLWLLRFDHGVVSAGFVLDPRRHPLDPGVPPAEEWAGWVHRFPSIAREFAGARIVDPHGGIVRTGRLQRRYERAAGPGWAALPHTVGFVDPLHSTGNAHTLAGVERLAATLARHWDSPSLDTALDAYAAAVDRELRLVDALVAPCYAAAGSFRLFTASALLYFAAVIGYEQHRLQLDAEDEPRLLLCADDGRLHDLAAGSLGRLAGLRDDGHMHDPGAIREFERYVEVGIEPWNTAGLFHPPRPNMYPHTAAKGPAPA